MFRKINKGAMKMNSIKVKIFGTLGVLIAIAFIGNVINSEKY